MDPRQSLSRTASSNIQQQSPYNNPNMSAYAGNIPPQPSYGGTHLPPITSNYQGPQHLPAANTSYMPQPPFRDNVHRYAPNQSPAGTPDSRYPPQMSQPQPMSNMPQNSMLPQPTSQTPQPQSYTTQPGTRPNSYPQPLAPAPPRPSMNDPYGQYGQPGPDRPWTGAEQIPGMTADLGRDPTRTHVVGSQGRRGILPSAPGRPPVMQNGLNGSPKGNTIPQKDADGKFPCPSCTKTYLHAKHLKRHMLRHTGDRPYMCVLCTDTFSRSDILKRHFQKCSVRRGNPTGASHLSNPAAHLKKSQAAAQKAAAAAASAAQSPATQQGNNNNPPASSGAVQASPYATSMPGNSMPATTASLPAMTSMPYANGQNDSKSHINQQGQGGLDQNSNANWAMHNGRGNHMMYNSNTASPAQGGHHVENDWNQFLPQAGNDNPYLGYGYEAHPEVKNESHESGPNGYYVPPTSLGADGTLGPPAWHFTSAHEPYLRSKMERLVDFCFPPGIQVSLQEAQNNRAVRSMLTDVELFQHFLELYQNYQGHFPWLHLPTFDVFGAYDGLLLMIICSGAVYSDRISQADVRRLVFLSNQGIQRTSRLLHYYTPEDVISPTKLDLEELQALFLSQNILTWHGSPEQRAQAREESRRLLQFVRQCQLLTLAPPGHEAHSYLHNLRPEEFPDYSQWDWNSWLLQEQRLRLAFLALLADAALTLFFNCPPVFQSSDFRLPLPCDDAAWDAPDPSHCASALGLYGPQHQSHVNITGSLQPKQINLAHAYHALHEPTIVIAPRGTNAYGKFILVHVLHMDIWRLQRQQSQIGPNASPYAGTESVNIESKKRAISLALNRWKHSWDNDVRVQYPSSSNGATYPRRDGFCRDGIHFYWLAKAFLQPNRVNDWKLPADVRFRQFLHGLKRAREWSLNEGAHRGEEPGSVADIDPTYEMEKVDLDMRKLFRPLLDV